MTNSCRWVQRASMAVQDHTEPSSVCIRGAATVRDAGFRQRVVAIGACWLDLVPGCGPSQQQHDVVNACHPSCASCSAGCRAEAALTEHPRAQGRPPSTIVEHAAQQVLALLRCVPAAAEQMQGVDRVEWWAHTRDPSELHQLHFDANETRFRQVRTEAWMAAKLTCP
jgi:hypothetical protein